MSMDHAPAVIVVGFCLEKYRKEYTSNRRCRGHQ